MTFHELQLKSPTLQAGKTKLQNCTTFQVFHDPYEPSVKQKNKTTKGQDGFDQDTDDNKRRWQQTC